MMPIPSSGMVGEGWGGSELEIANIDGDPTLEIIANHDDSALENIKTHVIDGVTRTQEWLITNGGFGKRMALGDVDGDEISEIAYIMNDDEFYVMDGDTRTIKWQKTITGYKYGVGQGDVNGDGLNEVIVCPGEGASLSVYNGSDGALLQSYGMGMAMQSPSVTRTMMDLRRSFPGEGNYLSTTGRPGKLNGLQGIRRLDHFKWQPVTLI